MEKKFAASTIIEDKEKLVTSLECHVEADDKRMLDIAEHAPLCPRMLHLGG
jgi:hypothetical protein